MKIQGQINEIGQIETEPSKHGVVVAIENPELLRRVQLYSPVIVLTGSHVMAYDEDVKACSELINYLTAAGTDFSRYGNKHAVEIAIAELRMLQWASGTVAGDVRAEKFLFDVGQELQRARDAHPPMHSLHEAYAVILEEMDEFKALVWQKQSHRVPKDVYTELVHLAAMVARCVADCGPDDFTK